MHEDLHREQRVDVSSDRSFGLVMSAALLVVGLWPLVSAGPMRLWVLVAALVLAAFALLAPRVLHRPNLLWAKLGLLLGKVVSPVVLGVLFFLVLAPFGFVMRALGKDPLRLTLDRDATTYWIERNPPGPAPGSMTDQF